MADLERELNETKLFLIEYGTMFAMYDGVDDLALDRGHYEHYLSIASDSKLRMIRYALHFSTAEKERLEEVVLKAHQELIENDFGKSIEEL